MGSGIHVLSHDVRPERSQAQRRANAITSPVVVNHPVHPVPSASATWTDRTGANFQIPKAQKPVIPMQTADWLTEHQGRMTNMHYGVETHSKGSNFSQLLEESVQRDIATQLIQ